MRTLSFAALIFGILLIPTSVGLAKLDHDRKIDEVQRMLIAETQEHGGALDDYFARARSNILLTANSPAFADVLAEPGTRRQKVARQGRSLRDVTHSLGYLEKLYPSAIGEACFIDAEGEELARVVRGDIAPAADLSTEEEQAPFFAPAFALDFGQTHQTRPYVSPDTGEWVVANATLIPQPGGRKRAIVHFEVTVESFRRAIGSTRGSELRVVDGATGRVVIDGTHEQRVGEELGVPGDRRYAALADLTGRSGVTEIDGRVVAYRRMHPTAGNANEWMLVATAQESVGGIGPAPVAMLALALVTIVLGGVSLRTSRRELERQATTDALTGLGNRRKLMSDLARGARAARADDPAMLTIFDLNGFKDYNDSFGHPAGDALLIRLGHSLRAAVAPFGGRAYRPGGDEFCVLAPAAERSAVEEAARAALSESGEGFAITSAFGTVVIPHDTADATEALRQADASMYAQKHSGRASASRQSTDVLLRALSERHPDLGDHQHGVAELAAEVAERMGLEREDLAQLRHAAALHDIGKVAIPDAIITKPGPLTDEEWAFMRRHTLIGERIVAAAPALGPAARLVRSSHEAWDGRGYPDALAGADIPLGARIIAVCDAFDAMVSERPYSPRRTADQALEELRRCAGTQFDPRVVRVFEEVVTPALRARPRAA
jgi:diguanylate cyclase (GGDEF)-like protein